jgi:CheY-like chemotaxis protein
MTKRQGIWPSGQHHDTDCAMDQLDVNGLTMGGRVLIVDDDAALRWSLASRLRAEGLDAHAVATGSEALHAVEAELFCNL